MKPKALLPGLGALTPLLLTGALAAGCNIVEAKEWNLRQVHQADGSPKRTGVLRSDWEFLIAQLLDSLRFQQADFLKGKEEQIEDPLGTCLENLIGLKEGDSDDPRTLAVQVELFSWLAAQDTYALSRERCALELGLLGKLLGVDGPLELAPEDVPATPREVAAALTDLIRAARPLLTGSGVIESPETLAEVCRRIADMTLDLDGARRLVFALATLLQIESFEGEGLAPLNTLLTDLEQRCVRFGMQAVLDDPDPRVRAAAVEAGVVMTDNRSPGLLKSALNDQSEPVRVRALQLLAERGLPQPGAELSPEEAILYERGWIDSLVNVLRISFDGPISVGACRALARISDAPFEDLRPEVWVDWWTEEQRLWSDDGVPDAIRAPLYPVGEPVDDPADDPADDTDPARDTDGG